MQKFTSLHLLQHIFHETPVDIAPALHEALIQDARLNEEYQDIYQTLLEIDQFELTPSDRLIQRVMSEFKQERDTHIA